MQIFDILLLEEMDFAAKMIAKNEKPPKFFTLGRGQRGLAVGLPKSSCFH